MLGEFLVYPVQEVARGGEVQAGTGWQGGVKMVSKVTRISSDGKAGCPFCDRKVRSLMQGFAAARRPGCPYADVFGESPPGCRCAWCYQDGSGQ